MAFRGLQAESAAQGEAHRTVAKELKELVADPFAEWAAGHKVGYITPIEVIYCPFTDLAFIRNEFMLVGTQLLMVGSKRMNWLKEM